MGIRSQLQIITSASLVALSATAAEPSFKQPRQDRLVEQQSETVSVKLPCHDYLCSPTNPQLSSSRTSAQATTDVGNPVPGPVGPETAIPGYPTGDFRHR